MTTSQVNQTQLERDILAGLMMPSAKTAPTAAIDLRPEYFQMAQHRTIYKAICNLWDRQAEVDITTVSEELASMGKLDEAGGRLYVSDIVCSTNGLVDHLSPVYVDFLIERYKGLEMSRLVAEMDQALASDANADQLVTLCRTKLDKLAQLKKADLPQQVSEIFPEIDAHIELARGLGGVPGIKSGFPDLDEKTNGFRPGQFILIAARPGMCKTTIALNMAVNMARLESKRILFYSLEMSKVEITMRLVALLAQTAFQSILRGNLSADEFSRIENARQIADTLDIDIADQSDVGLHTLNSNLEAAERKGKPYDVVIIDYLQLMKVRQRKDDNRNLEVSELSRGLKLLAKERAIPVIALCQLNRAVELRQNKRPQLSDLRDSGSLEQDTDLVFGLYRDEYYNPETDRRGEIELIVLKNRHGDSGTVDLLFSHGKCSISPKVGINRW